MKTLLIAILAVSMVGCASMTEKQKHYTEIVASVLIVGAIAAHKTDNGSASATSAASVVGPAPSCFPQPDGSCR